MLKLCPVPPCPSSQFSTMTQPRCAFSITLVAGLRPGCGVDAFGGVDAGFGTTSQVPIQKSNSRCCSAVQSNGFAGGAAVCNNNKASKRNMQLDTGSERPSAIRFLPGPVAG